LCREDKKITVILTWNGLPSEKDDGKPREADITFDFSDKLLKDVCDLLSVTERVIVPIAIPYYWLKDFTLDHDVA
jgi:hypothetical protein